MSVHAHLESLAAKHRELEENLHKAYVSHDQESLRTLKRDKLKIKDEIARLLQHVSMSEAA